MVTVAIIGDLDTQKVYWLEHLVGRLYQTSLGPYWYVDFQDREMAEMVVANLNALNITSLIIEPASGIAHAN